MYVYNPLHKRMLPSAFNTVTTGDAHSECWTGSMIPCLSSLASSSSTTSLWAYGTGLTLQNFGTASGFTRMLTCGPEYVPSPSSNTALCSSNMSSSLFTVLPHGFWTPFTTKIVRIQSYFPAKNVPTVYDLLRPPPPKGACAFSVALCFQPPSLPLRLHQSLA